MTKLCGVCEKHKAAWTNRFLLGSDLEICRACFTDWYDHGITNPATRLRVWRIHARRDLP